MNDPILPRCPACIDHPGWWHGDVLQRNEPQDVCSVCHGSGVRQPPTWSKTCETCEEGTVRRYRGQGDVECPSCGQPYNACGQRLARNWADNPSNWDDEVSDLDGYETAALRREEY